LTVRLPLLGAALAAVLCTPSAYGEAAAPAAAQGDAHDVTLSEYRQHLGALSAVVAACAKARDSKSCDPALAGQDDRVPLSTTPQAERRLVSYRWLRALLLKAQEKDESTEKAPVKALIKSPDKTQGEGQKKDQGQTPGKPVAGPVLGVKPDSDAETTRPPKPTTSQLLQAAEARLTQDIAQADAAAAGPAAAAADHAQERETMKQVLAGRDFRGLKAPTAQDSALEKLGAWLNRLFASAAKLKAGAAWVGRAMVWGFILAVCVGLAWALLQLERRWRIRLVPESYGPAAGAASARDWQLWLADARRCASAGQWREAIHFVYWAAISRLESKRLWPADRARTPREYLALVRAEDPRRAGLATLTGSFERSWYGGRAAGESDYLRAEELAAGLIAGSGTASEGGGR
jgi:hypothetical protein